MATYKDVGGMAPIMPPEEVARKQQLAKMLMEGGQDTSNMRHWTQALGSVLQTGVGSYLAGDASRGQAAGQAAGNKALAQMLMGGDPSAAMANPYVADKAMSLSEKRADRGYAEGKEKRDISSKSALAAQAGLKPGTPEFMEYVYGIRNPRSAEMPATVREYEYYKGLDDKSREEYHRLKRASPYLDIGSGFVTPNPATPGAPPTPVVTKDLAGAEREKVIGRETGERAMGAPKAKAALDGADAKTDLVLSKVQQAKKLVSPFTTGMPGAVLSALPGTAARDLAAVVDTLKANAGFGELQTMRDNSPTGGALGQVAVQELAMLQATITSLEQAQTAAQFARALDEFETFQRESKVRRKMAYDMTYGSGAGAPASPEAPPAGWGLRRLD